MAAEGGEVAEDIFDYGDADEGAEEGEEPVEEDGGWLGGRTLVLVLGLGFWGAVAEPVGDWFGKEVEAGTGDYVVEVGVYVEGVDWMSLL